MEKFCKNCGAKMNETERFCPNCGTDNGAGVGPDQNMQQPNMNYNGQPNMNMQQGYNQQPNMNYNGQPNMNYNGGAPAKYSGLAIASFVCSMVGIFVFGLIMGILAVCLAAAAKNRAKSFPEEKGRGLATAGLVIGIIEIIIMLWFMFTATALVSSYTSLF